MRFWRHPARVIITCTDCGHEHAIDWKLRQSRLCNHCWANRLVIQHGHPPLSPCGDT